MFGMIFRAGLPGSDALYHLLWGLLFLKAYGTEYTMSPMVKTIWKTFKKWAMIVGEEIASLTYVSILVGFTWWTGEFCAQFCADHFLLFLS